MVDRNPVELKWRREFDELGEEGVREKLFRGTIQTNQRKEGFAYRWLGEKRQEQEEKNRKGGGGYPSGTRNSFDFSGCGCIPCKLVPGPDSLAFLAVGVGHLRGKQ